MELSPEEVQNHILAEMARARPATQTHSQMAERLKAFISDAHRVAMNMDVLAKRGSLGLVTDGWDGHSHTKRYRLP